MLLKIQIQLILETLPKKKKEYIDYAKIIIGVLGYKVFKPLNEIEINNHNYEKEIFYLKNSKVEAKCRQSSEGFVLLKGSKISKEIKNYLSPNLIKHREKVKNNILEEDMLFSSISSAAKFVLGYSINGWDVWKNQEGKTFKEINNS